MRTPKQTVHFLDSNLLSPTNPIRVNVIGAGGTGSKMITCLMEINHSLIALGYAGLQVHLWDNDVVTEANRGRQRFAESEKGLQKVVAIINRINRWDGLRWKAESAKFQRNQNGVIPANASAAIYISCTDTVSSRFEISEIINSLGTFHDYRQDQPKYWLDFGNSRFTGQVLLSTIKKIEQPKSKKFKTTDMLPSIIEEYGKLMVNSEAKDDTPSCSLEESLQKQDLFINSTLAQMGASLLWNLLVSGMTEYRGFFLNLKDFRSQPITVGN
ncbi:thiamine biosynthesis protein ThiF [Sphingobacterium sp. Ag1]|uniref:PRTRC system ThiF family protein n=1 Tax=Sphingobacterium sp. Ag1 TaxID=1643451 RepID=UPI0006281B25|nr:PRTRC system ThiF family protein [Sphingobacterium sp. Ag1]KKO89183.1 thiamine biosynthesis protein ThiF [Sphingobacterium sp. Ag1]